MARKQRRSDLDEPVAEASTEPSPFDVDQPPRRPRKFLRRCLTLAVLAAVVGALAPEIVARTALLQRVVDWGVADLQGRAFVGSASLSWFSPPTMSNVELFDEAGFVVVKAPSAVADRSLWQIASSPTQLGRLRFERPEIHLVVADDGTTNIERVLAKYLAPSTAQTESSSGVDVAVQIVDGTLFVHDHATQRAWTVERLNAVIVVPREARAPYVADLQGSLQHPDGARRIALQGSLRNAANSATEFLPQGDGAATLEGLPLELVQVLAKRFLPGLALGGMLHGDFRTKFDFAAAQPMGDLSGRLTAANLSVGGRALQGDEIRLAQFDVPVRASMVGNRLQIDELTATCELASLGLSGSLDDARRLFRVAGLGDLANLAVECDGQATARVDLARISQALPHVVRIRDDVQVTGGTVTLVAQSGGAVGARKQQLEFSTSGLTALRGGQPIAWQQPMQAAATLATTPAGPTIERLQCSSDFFSLDGVNGPQAFTVDARYDLARLEAQLAQFLDLGGLQLRGNGTARVEWQRTADGRFQVDARAAVAEFALTAAGLPPWTEQQLILALDATGRNTGFALTALDALTAGLQSGEDEVTLRLLEPVADARRADIAWPIAVVGKGDLDTWVARVRPFAGLPSDLKAAGRFDLNLTARASSAGTVDVVQSQLAARPFRWQGYGLTIDEPQFDVQAAGRVSPTEASLTGAGVQCESIQAQVRQFAWRKNAAGAGECSGDVALRADVARLTNMFRTPSVSDAPVAGATTQPFQIGGILEGNAQLRAAAGVTNVGLSGAVNNFFAVQPGGPSWQEPLVKLTGTATYDGARDALNLERLEASAGAMQLLLGGKVDALSTARIVDCRGELTCDLAQMTPLAQAYLGRSVAFAGRETHRFELSGPLADPSRGGAFSWEKLNGAASVTWQQANLYGFLLGRTTLDARLSQGLLRLNPTEVAVNTGKVRLAPSLKLGPGPMELQVEPGTVVDHVSITPEMANERLQYVVPILAGVTQVSGQFSVAIDELRMPLDDPAKGTMTGRVAVHAIDLGPSILLQELAPIIKQPLSASLKRESIVDFKLIQGRIYHQGLEFAFPEVTVRTSGSVGLDQTLALTAEVALPAKLLSNVPVASAALSNQTIRLPIGGTLQRPGIDGRALAEATRQTIQNAAEGALEQGINRGLERLFGPAGAAPQPGTTLK